ncbi:MAG: tetratricopeptide repeat protein [Promethearchaeota archaeon]
MSKKMFSGQGKKIFNKLKELFTPRSVLFKGQHVSEFKSEDLIRTEKLMNECKYDEALLLMNSLEGKDDITDSDKLSYYLLKSECLNELANYEEVIKFAEKAYQKSQKLRDNLGSIDALVKMAFATMMIGDFEKAFNLIEQSEDLFKTLTRCTLLEQEQTEASITFTKATIYVFQGNVNLALECAKRSLELREDIGNKIELAESLYGIGLIYSLLKSDLDLGLMYAERCQTLAEEINHQRIIAMNLQSLGIIYFMKGEFKKSVKYTEQSLAIAEKTGNKQMIASNLNNIANLFMYQGDFDKALTYLERSLEIAQEIGNNWFIATSISSTIEVLVYKGDNERAQRDLEQLEEINDKEDNKIIDLTYRYSKARVLKTSPRIHNRAKAEEIFKQIVQEEMIHGELTINSFLNLCELLLDELRTTNEIEVLNELENTITQLLALAESTGSYWVLAETYALQGKLALLTLDLKGARRLLTQAQQIAEKHGMNLLAGKISIEHDNLLKELNKWEDLKDQDVSLKERVELAHIDEQIDNLLWKRDFTSLEHSEEEPILLLVLSEGGIAIFSHVFSKEWSFEDDLFGGFLSAINSFSGELFSKGLDRAKFGEHTVLMKSVASFSICYLFKGQSYLAQKRINNFIKQFENTTEIWQTFNNFYKTHQTIELNKNASLKLLITDIFILKKL